MTLLGFLMRATVLGVAATVFLDLWNLTRAAVFDIALTRYEFIGRWLMYMLDGRFVHESIRAAEPRAGELIAGWTGHYAIGVLFAMMLLAGWGHKWLRQPRLFPVMLVAMVTCAIPFFIMQPAMGSGVLASLTPDPAAARMKVIVSHLVFGVGLYFAGWLWRLLARAK
jgi:hypothetical protein